MIECLAYGGTAASVGVPPPGQKFIPELIALHEKGEFPIDRLCRVYDVADIDKATSDMMSGQVIKPVLKWT
ncbi:hypothetical protein QBC46DRAFT_337445 [Diplogelasinospora grovesii]|uniref:Aryl-alcohol dehydrogenase n=1 Tax=Diplogelasinospora grovesii TaxID=303347 RepID=A0AAN6S8H9_9PEZI|nr:hypothetical protein QBC46DRAFT_337445 [Diplogelasinospora grovesii]